ncbi:MAG: preprotein translocase subunit SecA [Firmicutes bacterium]|nr:preprotein translocase subunit SecA [Bacillota bacterium]
MGLFEKIFGDANDKIVKKASKTADEILALESKMAALSDDELRGKTAEFRSRLAAGETLDDLLVEAFAVCREGAWRSLGMKHFKVQLIGGIVLHNGDIAEMKTGEGKTLVATLPVYLNALEGKGVHVVTVNDYLAKRDMEWMGKLYSFLGLTVGCVIHEVTGEARKQAYLADITYGTNNEFGFDYLRDNMATYQEELIQRPLNYAIVDEVDSILIDEARTPLIISGIGAKSTAMYDLANRFVQGLKLDEDFTMDEKDRTISLTEEGIARIEAHFHIENFSDPENMELNHHILSALRAHNLMKRDVDYIIKDGQIVIVDQFTGRLMFGRRYSEGLHQAIEAKEHLKVREESKTLATITLQNYFRMYNKLAGMTGTAKTEEDEFRDIYNMEVVVIPTNKPIAREDLDDGVYGTEKGKYRAIADDVAAHHATGQPVLVGTISIERSELLSDLLKKRGIPHNVLNAKQHEREAEIVAEAGRKGAVTIATTMAGRGTDIILGGNPEFSAKREMRRQGYEDAAIQFATSFTPSEDPELLAARESFRGYLAKFKAEMAGEQEEVRRLGGLHIIGSERHESRRIDNQLRGRAGRQGDPGSTQFFISLEDDLMRLFGGDRMQGLIGRLGVAENEPIQAGMLSKTIETAQKRVEGRNFGIRKSVLRYDDVMNKQRTIIYGERRRVLDGENLRDHILSMAEEIVQEAVDSATAGSKYAEEWDFERLTAAVRKAYMGFPGYSYSADALQELTPEQLRDDTMAALEQAYSAKEAEVGEANMRELERMVMLKVVDNKWMDHIDAMHQLKKGIGLRAMGGVDPAVAYAQEGFEMIDLMIHSIKDETVHFCFNVSIRTNSQRRSVITIGAAQKAEAGGMAAAAANGPAAAPVQTLQQAQGALPNVPQEVKRPVQTPVRKEKTPGRNDPCPCGSGKKYKNCCGKVQNEE